jgi:hypothetical protein
VKWTFCFMNTDGCHSNPVAAHVYGYFSKVLVTLMVISAINKHSLSVLCSVGWTRNDLEETVHYLIDVLSLKGMRNRRGTFTWDTRCHDWDSSLLPPENKSGYTVGCLFLSPDIEMYAFRVICFATIIIFRNEISTCNYLNGTRVCCRRHVGYDS